MGGGRKLKQERDGERLAEIYAGLPAAQREMLLAFAEFLAARAPAQEPAGVPPPREIPRPEKESVIAAVKRLSASYYMIDRSLLLHDTSALVTQHLMQGRGAAEVIEDLECLFRRQYERLSGGSGEPSP